MNQRSGASYLFPILLIIIAAFECYGQSMTDATCAKKNPPVPTGSKCIWQKNTYQVQLIFADSTLKIHINFYQG